MTARIPARSRRQAMDWSLVLISQGIETTIDFAEESGWGLIVAGAGTRACTRNSQTIPARKTATGRGARELSPQGALFDWASLGWVLLVGMFFWIQTHATSAFQERGVDGCSRRLSRRMVAALYGDFPSRRSGSFCHERVALALFLLGLTMGNFGTGLGLLAAYLAGAGGNIATWLIYLRRASQPRRLGNGHGLRGIAGGSSNPFRTAMVRTIGNMPRRDRCRRHAVCVAWAEPGLGRARAFWRLRQWTGARMSFAAGSASQLEARGKCRRRGHILRVGDFAVVAGAASSRREMNSNVQLYRPLRVFLLRRESRLPDPSITCEVAASILSPFDVWQNFFGLLEVDDEHVPRNAGLALLFHRVARRPCTTAFAHAVPRAANGYPA